MLQESTFKQSVDFLFNEEITLNVSRLLCLVWRTAWLVYGTWLELSSASQEADWLLASVVN
jgi:hypothetical protein